MLKKYRQMCTSITGYLNDYALDNCIIFIQKSILVSLTTKYDRRVVNLLSYTKMDVLINPESVVIVSTWKDINEFICLTFKLGTESIKICG